MIPVCVLQRPFLWTPETPETHLAVKRLAESARDDASGAAVTPIAQPRGEFGELVVASFPEVSMRDLVVGSGLRVQLEEVISEQRQRHALMDQGFDPVHRLRLEGPPAPRGAIRRRA